MMHEDSMAKTLKSLILESKRPLWEIAKAAGYDSAEPIEMIVNDEDLSCIRFNAIISIFHALGYALAIQVFEQVKGNPDEKN